MRGPPALTAPALSRLLLLPFDRAAWEAVSGPHLHLRIGNAAPAMGRDVALRAYGGFRGRLTAIGCRYCDYWERREAIFAETDVCFVGHDGSPREIPCTIIARVTGGLLQDLRLHLDPTPIP
jgi:hypothetical protein